MKYKEVLKKKKPKSINEPKHKLVRLRWKKKIQGIKRVENGEKLFTVALYGVSSNTVSDWLRIKTKPQKFSPKVPQIEKFSPTSHFSYNFFDFVNFFRIEHFFL